MKRFTCPSCRAPLFFENLECLACSEAVVYDRAANEIVPATALVPCTNRELAGCNWASAGDKGLCASCALTSEIPDLSDPENVRRFALVETAKRRLIYGLDRLGLPVENAAIPLVFRIVGDVVTPEGKLEREFTGHDSGEITLNIAEADDAVREKTRVELGEPFRTLVGHFRHEIGHFYWDLLVRDAGQEAAFTQIFGDAGADYGEAMERHYAHGAPEGWRETHVSAYATMHPWEDWAESWAHYMHMVGGLETAASFHVGDTVEPEQHSPIEALTGQWIPLSVVMNEMNRSVGQPDFYPFVLSDTIIGKLGFVHRLIRAV